MLPDADSQDGEDAWGRVEYETSLPTDIRGRSSDSRVQDLAYLYISESFGPDVCFLILLRKLLKMDALTTEKCSLLLDFG